jgi:hypothetical protein
MDTAWDGSQTELSTQPFGGRVDVLHAVNDVVDEESLGHGASDRVFVPILGTPVAVGQRNFH